MSTRSARTIAVLVGTDHHPFARLISWADTWAAAHPDDDVVVQYGHSPAPQIARGDAFLPPSDLASLIEVSDIVVVHGGPATISGARAAGHLPIVFPRDPHEGEHVDDHQQRFSRWSDARGLVTCVESLAHLSARIEILAATEEGSRVLSDVVFPGTEGTAVQLTRLLARRRHHANRSSDGAPVLLYTVTRSEEVLESLCQDISRQVQVTVLGDTQRIWEGGVLANRDCSCGLPFNACDFWQETGKMAFGGWEKINVDSILSLRKAVEKRAVRIRSTSRFESSGLRGILSSYSSILQSIYSAARDVTGSDVLVHTDTDSSLAMALSHNREIDLRYVDATDGLKTAHPHNAKHPYFPNIFSGPTAQRRLGKRGVPSATLLSPAPGMGSGRWDMMWGQLGISPPEIANTGPNFEVPAHHRMMA